jgi:hypothetical protein
MAAAHPQRIAPSRAGAREKCSFANTFAPVTPLPGKVLTDNIKSEERAVATPNQDTVYGFGIERCRARILAVPMRLQTTLPDHNGPAAIWYAATAGRCSALTEPHSLVTFAEEE